jgi:hypothetical protein
MRIQVLLDKTDRLGKMLRDKDAQAHAKLRDTGYVLSAIERLLRAVGVVSRHLDGMHAGVALQILGSTVRDLDSSIEDREPMATFRLVHVVSGHHDGRTAFGKAEQICPEVTPALGVDGTGRLVEQKQLRVMKHGAGERKALFLTATHGSCQLPALHRFVGGAPLWGPSKSRR